MSLLNHLVVLNLLDLSKSIPTLPEDQREQVLDIVLSEMQAALRDADEQIITIKTKHARDETNLVGVMKSIQDLHKADAPEDKDKASQLTALQEARSRLEEDLEALQIEEKQLRQEVARLMAKVNSAEVQRPQWLSANPDIPKPINQPNERTYASGESKKAEEPPRHNGSHSSSTGSANQTSSQPQEAEASNFKFGYARIDEPFERLEQLKSRIAANEISQQEATRILEQEMRNFELEKLFQTQEEEEQLTKELADLKRKLM